MKHLKQFMTAQVIANVVAWILVIAFVAYLFFRGAMFSMPIELRSVTLLLLVLALWQYRKDKARGKFKPKPDSGGV